MTANLLLGGSVDRRHAELHLRAGTLRLSGEGDVHQDVGIGHTQQLVQFVLLYLTVAARAQRHVHGCLVLQLVERAAEVLQRVATLGHDVAHLRDDAQDVVVQQRLLVVHVAAVLAVTAVNTPCLLGHHHDHRLLGAALAPCLPAQQTDEGHHQNFLSHMLHFCLFPEVKNCPANAVCRRVPASGATPHTSRRGSRRHGGRRQPSRCPVPSGSATSPD